MPEPIEDVDELEEDAHYHILDESTPAKWRTFKVNLEYKDCDDFADYGEGAIQLQYRDGYVADMPVSSVERQIDNGRMARGKA